MATVAYMYDKPTVAVRAALLVTVTETVAYVIALLVMVNVAKNGSTNGNVTDKGKVLVGNMYH